MPLHPVLHQAVLLDSETLGLNRKFTGIHELSLLELEKRHVRGWTVAPNAVEVQAAAAQERTGLASAYRDAYTRVPTDKSTTWMDLINKQAAKEAGRRIALDRTMAELRARTPWMAQQIPRHPHLLGNKELPGELAARAALMKSYGYTADLGRPATIQGLLGNELPAAIRGKTVWIANAAFEAKHIGAQLAAEGPEAALAFKSQFETFNPRSPDPFYVTGSEVSRARVVAGQSGDWTGVWRAYKANVPAAGQTAVRDIQDVVRAVHSYGYKLGLTSADLSYMGTSVEASHKMFASAMGDGGRLTMAEFHRAAEDLTLHEAYVLERSVGAAEALQQVHENTKLGAHYRRQAQTGAGPLAEMARYFSALEAHGPALMEEQLLKRLHRGAQDIAAEDHTYQRVGDVPYKQMHMTPDGTEVPIWRLQARRRAIDNMDELASALDAEGRYGRYGASAQATYERMSAQSPDELAGWVHAEVGKLRASWKDAVPSSAASRLAAAERPGWARLAAEAAQAGRGAGKYLAAAGGILAFMGAGVGAFQDAPEQPSSVLHYGYRDWVQQERIEGLSEGTVASSQRHQMTDFGSPYRGPVGVEQVFIDQQLLRERERWLRAQYGARHYDPAAGATQPFRGWRFSSGNKYIHAGQQVAGEDYGLRGNLMALNMDGGWKMEAEDADTVVVKRGGIRGALTSFFGMNRGFSFRLAGVDSPETSHGAGSYHAPQPGATEAAQAVRQILAGAKNVQLMYDPTQITYGRMMGAVIVDGQNMNFQLVRQGLAAHLPFGKYEDSIINYGALKGAETRAYQTNRGIWAQPWARAFYEHAEASGNRVTFNTLAKSSSIVQNTGTMAMLSMMEQTQRNGQFGERDTLVARELGASYRVGADKVEPWAMSAPSRPSHSYMTEQLADISHFTKTKGRGHLQNKFSTRGNYGQLDNAMVLDTLGTSDNVWTRRKYGSFEKYQSTKVLNRARKERAAAAQRQALRAMNESPIGHHRM
jgi:endonuclease YncB( thermonuclease family)